MTLDYKLVDLKMRMTTKKKRRSHSLKRVGPLGTAAARAHQVMKRIPLSLMKKMLLRMVLGRTALLTGEVTLRKKLYTKRRQRKTCLRIQAVMRGRNTYHRRVLT